MLRYAAVIAVTALAVNLAFAGFYKSEPRFSMRPKEGKIIHPLTRFGPVGISIDLIQPTFTMRINGVEGGSPSAKAGLKPGMFIQKINGEGLNGIDPRIQLGDIITKAEATDGKVAFMVSDKPKGEAREIVVQLPVLGAYSDTWPLNCKKSDQIVRDYAEFLKKPNSNKGFADIGMLFLLSTGDESDLAVVRDWARAHKGGLTYSWHIGYGGIALCEYYLRTGDKEVLPAIQRITDTAIKMENFGGWGGRGAIAGVNYGGGGGHVNAGGSLVPAFVFLAKECGADMPDASLQRITHHWIRWVGRGNVAYGNTRPEAGFTDNGRNGKLAFSMAAAAALTQDENSVYARARDVCALFSFYSTTYMLHGHTGGGIGEIHRSQAMGLLAEKMPKQYRSFMDARRWHYEMSRRWDGSFAILGGDRYDNVSWGSGYAMTYTIPRKTLRITGAPPTKFSKKYKLPELPWGTAEDNDFLSIKPIANADGSLPDISALKVLEDSAFPMHRKLRSKKYDIDAVRALVRTPNYNLRRDIANKLVPAQGLPLIMEMLDDEDARMRRAALEAVVASRGKLFTGKLRDRVVAIIKDPRESWFVKDAAIQVAGTGPADWLVGQVDLILPYLEHREWWLQLSALEALGSVATDERVYKKVIPAIGKLARTNHLYNVLKPLRWGKLGQSLAKGDGEVQGASMAMLKSAYVDYQAYKHGLSQVEKTVNNANRDVFAELLTRHPGGYNELYKLAKARNPGATLPYRDVFLRAKPEDLGPELKAQVDKIIRTELIPAVIKKNAKTLQKLVRNENAGRGGEGALNQLVFLYQRMGIRDYDWQNFGPDQSEMHWHYHSFDPPEKWEGVSDRLGRYRPVTFPEGMEKWYALEFDPAEAGWKQGLAPFGASNGKKGRISGSPSDCPLSFCGCHKPINTLWENDVLLLSGKFKFPKLEEGHRYRLLHGGISHVGSGGGYRIYINGKLFQERKTGVDRRGGSVPIGRTITKEWWPEFAKGEATLSVITFKKNHPRTKKYGGNISIFMQRMKTPPVALE